MKPSRQVVPGAFFALALCACGFQPVGTGTGSDAGPVYIGEAVVAGPLAFVPGMPRANIDRGDGGIDLSFVSVQISNATLCPPTGVSGELVAVGATVLSVDRSPVVPGTYSVGNQPTNQDGGATYVGPCMVDYDFYGPDAGFRHYVATSGSVTVTTITPDRVVGSLDVVFAIPEGGSAPMTATFDAPYCWAPGSGSGK